MFLNRGAFADWHELDGPKQNLPEVTDRFLAQMNHGSGHS
jgi:hypothetical protein